jgi:signal transduction histidine kinase
VELVVRDTGVGISAAELPRLFERFHRVEGTRARTHEGSGIGLALVQELVQLHGGSIRVESAEQVGTRVAVELPTGASHLPAERVQARPTLVSTALGAAPYIREAERWLPDDAAGSAGIGEEVPPEPVLAGAVVGPAAQPDEGRRARIVLADDNADMRDYLRRLLSERYRVEAVANGAQALAAIRRDQPDLVLADVMMPEMDGFGLLSALRADPLTASLPVILLSARAGEEATIEGLEASADDYLVKPFSAREVLSRVAARLEAAPVRREALQRASQLETIIESVTDAVFIYDRDGRVMRMNSAARTLFGLDERLDYGKLSPQERTALISACDEQGQPIPAEQSGLYQLLRGESLTGPNAPDVRLRLAGGRELVVNITGAPLRDEAGAIVGAVAVSRDVTERRRLERARVLGLEEANARMDEFLGIASHELRTPLTSASANVQMVERGLRALNEEGDTLPEGLGEKLQHLHMLVRRTERQMGRLARLVGDLLHVSREQAGKLELRLEPCELLHIVREAVREQQAAWPDRSIVLELPRRAVSLLGDADRLGQVVTNYLGNALKYAPKEEPVTVRVRVRNGVARVEVTDRGPGLTPEQQEGLFERFYRAPGIEQQNGSGMGLGLGLYICRTIVERHGGALGVRSHAGQGSMFWFTLPLAAIKQEG